MSFSRAVACSPLQNIDVSGLSRQRRKQAEVAGCYLSADVLLPQHKDLGSEGRTWLESSEHQLNTGNLPSVSSDTREFLIDQIIIKDLKKKKNVSWSTSRKACIGMVDCDSETASHFARVTELWCKS